jgi:hypothetical protein
MIDGIDGAGVISGTSAVTFAKSMYITSPNGTLAVQNGIYTGPISENTGNYYNINFKIKIPPTLPTGSSPSLTDTVNDVADLDLVVPGFYCPGKGVNNENWGSWESNVEVAEIVRNLITPGSTINPYVRVWPFTIPASAYNKSINEIYYSIAWTWVKDHAD